MPVEWAWAAEGFTSYQDDFPGRIVKGANDLYRGGCSRPFRVINVIWGQTVLARRQSQVYGNINGALLHHWDSSWLPRRDSLQGMHFLDFVYHEVISPFIFNAKPASQSAQISPFHCTRLAGQWDLTWKPWNLDPAKPGKHPAEACPAEVGFSSQLALQPGNRKSSGLLGISGPGQ